MDRNCEIKHACVWPAVKCPGALVGCYNFSIERDELIARLNAPLLFARFDRDELFMNGFASPFFFGPKILAVNAAVCVPKRLVMGMIMLLIRDFFHGPIARERHFAR